MIGIEERENLLKMIDYQLVDTLVEFGSGTGELEDLLIRKGYPLNHYICIENDSIDLLKSRNRLFVYPNSVGKYFAGKIEFSNNFYEVCSRINTDRAILLLSEDFIENIRYLSLNDVEYLFNYISNAGFKYIIYQGVYYNPLDYGVNWEYIRDSIISNEVLAKWFRGGKFTGNEHSMCRYLVEYILKWAYHDINGTDLKNGYLIMNDFSVMLYGKQISYSRLFNSRKIENLVQKELGLNLSYLGTVFIETIIQN